MAARWRRIEIAAGIAVVLISIALIVPAVEHSREAARRQQSKTHLRLIGLALHSYHGTYSVLPPGGVFDAAGTAYVGWPMLILPYIDSNPFYGQIDFGVPWDQQPNPAVFRWTLNGFFTIPGSSPVVDDSGFGLSHYAGNQNLLFPNSSVSLLSVTDGLAQTILGGEIFADFIPYAKPGNWRNPANGLQTIPQSFGRPTADGAFILMGDGRVVWLQKQIDPAVFRALGTPDGGETIPKAILSDGSAPVQ
jgi:hypothetical protein